MRCVRPGFASQETDSSIKEITAVSFGGEAQENPDVRDKMQTFRLIFLGSALIPVLSGCSYLMGDNGPFRDRQADYLVAPIIPEMEIPDTLDSFTLDELYVIPPMPLGDRAFFVQAPEPRPMDTNVREGVVVQRFGDRRWIVIGAEPAQVWPRLRDYWSTAQIPLASEDTVRAVMETVWLGDDEGSRNKYQVRVEPGLHSGNSEVYVLQVAESYVSDPAAPVSWPQNSANLELEHAMLDDISLYLADRTDLYRASSVSLLAGSIEADSKSSIIPTSRGDTLQLRVDFDRAWSQVGQALTNAEIEVTESNRDNAFYSVLFSGAEEEDRPGFFARLFGADDTKDMEKTAFTLRLISGEGQVTVVPEQTSGAGDIELQNQLISVLNKNLI